MVHWFWLEGGRDGAWYIKGVYYYKLSLTQAFPVLTSYPSIVCCGTHGSLWNNIILFFIYCRTHRSSWLTTHFTSFVVHKGLAHTTPLLWHPHVSHAVSLCYTSHTQGFCATCTLVPHYSLIQSALPLVGQSCLSDYLAWCQCILL